MTPSSTALPGPSTEAGGPTLVRATSPAKSRLTIRLPDLSVARIPSAEPSAASPPTILAAAREIQQDRGSASSDPDGLVEQITKAPLSPSWSRQLRHKTLDLVRQPKFWLACVVAIAVQVVLALVMTPAEGVSERQQPATSAAQPWSKATDEPARRIVVPAAPVSVPDDRSETAPGVTTPLGPALPLDAGETSSQGNAERSVDDADEQVPAVRVADNPFHADAVGEVVTQPPSLGVAQPPSAVNRPSAQHINGATLGGIAPLEQGAPIESHERR